jgi:hypothetical protein
LEKLIVCKFKVNLHTESLMCWANWKPTHWSASATLTATANLLNCILRIRMVARTQLLACVPTTADICVSINYPWKSDHPSSGLMPHPDRSFLSFQWPDYPHGWTTTKKPNHVSPWIRMFENAFSWSSARANSME